MPYKDPIKNKECKSRWAKTDAAKVKKKEYYKEYKNTPRYKYTHARKSAISRGISWEFTFEEWLEIWYGSDKWEERSPVGYCMCRYGDEGPYSKDNIYIAHASQNKSDAYYNGKLHNIAAYNKDRTMRICLPS